MWRLYKKLCSKGTTNQDVHALMQKSSIIMLITPLKFKLETSVLNV